MSSLAFLFPGQGAQYVGMGKSLAETVPAARKLFDEASEVLGYDLLSLCLNGPAEQLNSTVISQPAIFVASMAALESLRQREPGIEAQVTATAGLSLGEYTALTFAGALTFRDGVRLVQKRGTAMQTAADAKAGAMVSIIGMERPQIEQLCEIARQDDTLQLANLLCPGNLVVSGDRDACDRVEKLVEAAGARPVRLTVAGAFHTALMKPADETLAKALSGIEIKPPRVPVWSNVDARPHTNPDEIRQLLVRQVVQPVLWEDCMRGLLASGVDCFYELGPKRVLAGLLKRISRKTECQNIEA